MLTDTIQISGLPETVIQGVSDRAKAVGTTAEEYVRYLIEEDLSSSSLNLRVLFAPVREQIKESGTSNDELYRVNVVMRQPNADFIDSSSSRKKPF